MARARPSRRVPRTCWSRSSGRSRRCLLEPGRRRPGGRAPCAGQGDHAGRVHPRRPPRPGRCPAHRADARHRRRAAAGHLRRAGRRQEHLHRGLRPVPDRPGPPRGRAGGGPVQQCLGRRHPGRQDAHGAPLHGPARLHPPQPEQRHARRRGREDARGDAAVRGGRVRRGHRRDRGCRPERDRRGGHDRPVRAAAAAQCRR
mmetsp:Transcript_5907/g.14566  ORF Transcript_5907/g.14566 Transcript_5907/m.14566 type:complete len:201 (-) Transcript_5907:659-1261(-)